MEDINKDANFPRKGPKVMKNASCTKTDLKKNNKIYQAQIKNMLWYYLSIFSDMISPFKNTKPQAYDEFPIFHML